MIPSRKITNIFYRIWDILPNFITESKFINNLIFKYLIGDWFDLGFFEKWKNLNNEEWIELYNHHRSHAQRIDDTTPLQRKEIIKNILGEKVLDVGCGTSTLTLEIAKHGFKTTGLDVSDLSLEHLKNLATEMNLDITLVQGFAENLPFPDKSFDTIVTCHTLEHVKDLEKMITELRRVAKDRIIILTPKEKNRKYAFGYHVRFFNDNNLPHSHLDIKNFEEMIIDGDYIYIGSLN